MGKREKFTGSASEGWIENELASSHFRDARNRKRLGKLLSQLTDQVGGSIPWATQYWANSKAAYRFFSNARVSEEFEPPSGWLIS